MHVNFKPFSTPYGGIAPIYLFLSETPSTGSPFTSASIQKVCSLMRNCLAGSAVYASSRHICSIPVSSVYKPIGLVVPLFWTWAWRHMAGMFLERVTIIYGLWVSLMYSIYIRVPRNILFLYLEPDASVPLGSTSFSIFWSVPENLPLCQRRHWPGCILWSASAGKWRYINAGLQMQLRNRQKTENV